MADTKTLEQIQQEQAEIKKLTDLIMTSTERVPAKIVNEASYDEAVKFKAAAIKARSNAQKNKKTLKGMQEAWASISHFYAGGAA